MEALLRDREETLERLCDRHDVSGCGQRHKTFFGRWALTYEAALRDVLLDRDQVQQDKDELRVLMLGCSSGQTVIDFLSIFHKAIVEIGLQTRCKILALDICESVVDIAENGFHVVHPGMDRRVDEIHGGVPWIFLDESRLMVKWEALKASGNDLEYRVFDADRDLSSLEADPFDLVEIKNCHNKNHAGEVANVGRVTHDKSLVMYGGGYTDRQECLFYEQFEAILRGVTDPGVLRFMSGLVRVHATEADFSKQAKMDCFKTLLKLAEACVEPWNGSVEDKIGFLQKNSPLLQFLGRIAALDGVATWFQDDAIRNFDSGADPKVKEALYGMYRFAFDSLHSDDGAEFCSLDRQAFYTVR